MAGLLTLDWRSIKRWCLIGALLMVGWLLLPTAKCSFQAFRDTPLTETGPHYDPNNPNVPAEEEEEEPGFFSKLGSSISSCYAKTPLFGQEDWKEYLLIGFASAWLLLWTVVFIDDRKRKTFDKDR
jgi:hypothetical protein